MKLVIILLIIAIISIVVLITFISLNKLKKYNERILIAEKNIDSNLEVKLNSIITINNELKKGNDEKDYLKEYIQIKDSLITNIEKDIKLDEAEKLINKLLIDNTKLSSSNKIKKQLVELRKTNEKIVSSKNMYNKNALLNNNLIKTFPTNIIAKIFKYKIISYYNNKTDDKDNF
jgi:LemA protein